MSGLHHQGHGDKVWRDYCLTDNTGCSRYTIIVRNKREMHQIFFSAGKGLYISNAFVFGVPKYLS